MDDEAMDTWEKKEIHNSHIGCGGPSNHSFSLLSTCQSAEGAAK
jgi:hypothetical protein